jgi:hypothetical protein
VRVEGVQWIKQLGSVDSEAIDEDVAREVQKEEKKHEGKADHASVSLLERLFPIPEPTEEPAEQNRAE